MITRIVSAKTETNCYFIEKEGYAIIIDPIRGDLVKEHLSSENITPEIIFLTHEHFDHIEGLEEIRDCYDIPVIACNICSERVQDVRTNLSNIADILAYFKTGKTVKVKTERYTCSAADITYDEEYEMEWRGIAFAFKRIPGHSPGSVMITLGGDSEDAPAVFTGDYMIEGEKEILRLKDGSQEDFDNISLPLLKKIPAGTHIYPGHGPNYINV